MTGLELRRFGKVRRIECRVSDTVDPVRRGFDFHGMEARIAAQSQVLLPSPCRTNIGTMIA